MKKTVLGRGNSYEYVGAVAGTWNNAAPITSINILSSATFSSGTLISIYGIQAGTPKAQGGNIVTTDGTYWYHAFTASGTFTPSSTITADYLVVGAGGGGADPRQTRLGHLPGGRQLHQRQLRREHRQQRLAAAEHQRRFGGDRTRWGAPKRQHQQRFLTVLRGRAIPARERAVPLALP